MWARTNPTVSLVGGSLPYLNSPSVQHPGGLGAGDSWPEAQLESPLWATLLAHSVRCCDL